MSVASLTRFTVPLASDQSASAQGLLMPKMKYRFRVSFENFGVSTPRSELTKAVMNYTRPQQTFAEVPVDVYNSKAWLLGKPEWQPSTVELRDDAQGSVARLIGEQLQKQYDFMEQSSASSGIDYKFITRFETLDGGNGLNDVGVLETWELYGCYIQDVNYNNFDYSVSEFATISMVLRYDNALQTPLGSGVGATVSRTLGEVVTG